MADSQLALLSPQQHNMLTIFGTKKPTCAYILCLLDPDTHFSVFKLWFTLRESANAEAPDFPTLFPSRL